MNYIPMLILEDIHKFYDNNEVLKGITLDIKKGELVTFVGPSGCGKTTLLRIIGGFTPLDSGRVILDNQRIDHLPPNLRDTRICFQNYALFPHMTVAENISYGLKIKKWKRNKIQERVEELLKLVKLEGLGERMIDKLSGGQQQRVAVARALSLEPKVLLLDEPLSNLDANLRLIMRGEIRKLQERLKITTIFVTHDQFEAMSISDRIVVLRDGEIQQIGPPIEIYEHPTNEFIAAFVGYVNFLDGVVDILDIGLNRAIASTPIGKIQFVPERSFSAGEKVKLVIRPETIEISRSEPATKLNVFEGNVEIGMYVGSLAKYTVQVMGEKIIIDQSNPRETGVFKTNEKIYLSIPENIHVLMRQ
ncbi:MAG: ABC transporter ATP-binding protein [Deltaproteobacteria bacterium]|nr:ABC transporter ATP-binding protein [Deltaproteobacteria bacterium]